MNANGPEFAIGWLLIVAMLAMILVVGIIVLLAFKATRPLGVGLLLFFFGGGLLLTFGLFFMRASAVPQRAVVYRHDEAATLAPRQATPEFRVEAHNSSTSNEQVTTPQPSAARELQAVPTDAVPTDAAPPVGTAQETPAKVVEPATSGDSHGEPAVSPPAVETPAEKPAEATTPAEANPTVAPAASVPAEAAPAQVDQPPTPATPAIVAEKLPTAPPVRPAWVDAPPRREQQDYQLAVKSGLFVTAGECERALEKAMQRAVDTYIDEYIEDGAADLVAIDPQFIQQRIRRGAFSDTSESSVGTMQQAYGLLVFDDSVRSVFQQRWRQALVNARLWQVGAGSAVVLGLIGTLFGFLSWGQRAATAQAIPSVVAEKSGEAVATSSRFWLHCAVVVAILIGVLAFLI